MENQTGYSFNFKPNPQHHHFNNQASNAELEKFGKGSNNIPLGAPRTYNDPIAEPPKRAKNEANPEENVFDGKSLRKSVQRRTVDYNSSLINYFEKRPWFRDTLQHTFLLPSPMYNVKMLPPSVQISRPSNAIATKWVSTSSNKNRCPINVVRWTPEGRRLITGCATGEFTLWNGLFFNFETILQAHEVAVRAMEWSHNDNWMITADHNGVIKYWQSNMNNLKEFPGHQAPIRDLAFSCTDSKFASCSDDNTIKIWNFNEGTEERSLLGHATEVKCLDWHPYKSLLASGSKDHMLKFWDPRTGKGLVTLHNNKSSILSLEWNRNGNWIVTTARDQLIKVFDIRMMKEFINLRGHKKEVSAVAWHPHYERMFATGGSDGAINFWNMSLDSPVGTLKSAHDNIIWSLDWHPVGHILTSGSNDNTTRFWTRQRPGDLMKKNEARYNGGTVLEDPNLDIIAQSNINMSFEEVSSATAISGVPGLGMASELPQPGDFPGLPSELNQSLDSSSFPPGLGNF